MSRPLLLASFLLVLPAFAFASTLESSRTLVLSDPQAANAYLSGTDITVVTPIPGDLLAAGGTVTANAPIGGDVMLAGGTVDVKMPVIGDVRAVGAHISVIAPVGGDLMLAGSTVTASSSARDTRIAAGVVKLTGSGGPVIIYGSDVTLSGTFKGDVTVEASDRITIADDTHIEGNFAYNAPEQIIIPPTALLENGAHYIGSSSFLPSSEQAHTFAIAGATIFFIAHLLAVLILAGLAAGLLPVFTERIAERTLSARSPSRFILLALLGFGILVATPVLIVILVFSFVGIGVALILAALYALFLLFSYIYAGVLAGTALARGALKRYVITWKEAVAGMLVLYLIGVIPVLGPVVKIVLMMAAGGAIAALSYSFIFRRSQDELPLE